jgi:single-stranded DNA-binding protein
MFECALIGTLGGDAEVKMSKAGKPYFSANLATGNGDQTTWVRVSVFGDRAVELAPTLKKEMQLYVTGRLTLDKWTGRDGHERTGISVAAGHIEPCEIGRQRQRRLGFVPSRWISALLAAVAGARDDSRRAVSQNPLAPAITAVAQCS